MMDLQTLVLNADYRPLSYNPLSLWSWKDAFTALFLDRVTLVASYDVEARSPSRSLRVPSVVALKSYVTLARSPAFTPWLASAAMSMADWKWSAASPRTGTRPSKQRRTASPS